MGFTSSRQKRDFVRRAPPASQKRAELLLRGLPSAKPGFVEPMKALLVAKLPKGPEWVYEVKFDGFRALVIKDGQRVSLLSRNGKDFTERYSTVAQALRAVPAKSAVLDGEIVAVDAEGRSSFQLLQTYLTPGNRKPPLFYTRPKGDRDYFGAILVGYYEGSRLLFASKVGTGFEAKSLASLHQGFQKLLRPDSPFANLPERQPGGLTATEMKTCHWLDPRLVCQVRFAEWTRDHHLRQPVFQGIREDKEAREVVRESPTASASQQPEG